MATGSMEFMDAAAVRRQSVSTARAFGLAVDPSLPLSEFACLRKTTQEVLDRLLALHAAVACAYGLPRATANAWLASEGLLDELCEEERKVLSGAADNSMLGRMKWRVEALWALAWCLGAHDNAHPLKPCDSNFVRLLPNLKAMEASRVFRARCRLRGHAEIFGAADLAFCIDWAVKSEQLGGRAGASDEVILRVPQRRLALEWMLGTEDWELTSVDT